MPDDFDGEDAFVAADFYTIVHDAQMNELEAEEKRLNEERERNRELARQQNPNSMSLMQVVGLRTKKELDRDVESKMEEEEKKSEETIQKEKEEAHARLTNKFPPPIV